MLLVEHIEEVRFGGVRLEVHVLYVLPVGAV